MRRLHQHADQQRTVSGYSGIVNSGSVGTLTNAGTISGTTGDGSITPHHRHANQHERHDQRYIGINNGARWARCPTAARSTAIPASSRRLHRNVDQLRHDPGTVADGINNTGSVGTLTTTTAA